MPQWMNIPRRASVNQVMSGLSASTGGAVSSADDQPMPEHRIKAIPTGDANIFFTGRMAGLLNLKIIKLKKIVVTHNFDGTTRNVPVPTADQKKPGAGPGD